MDGYANQGGRDLDFERAASGRHADRATAADRAPNRSRGRGAQRSEAIEGLPVEKNGEYEADIIGLTHDGDGVGRVNGYTLFVKGAMPGERALVKVMKLKKQYGYAKLIRILQQSPDRVAAPCPIFEQCGGCQLQHLSYEAQLRHKRQLVVDNLERIGKLKVARESRAGHQGARTPEGLAMSGGGADAATDVVQAEGRDAATAGARVQQREGIIVHPTVGMSDPWRYRNKSQVPIGLAGAGGAAMLGQHDSSAEELGLVGGFYTQGSHRIIDMDECLIQQENNDRVVAAVKRIARELGIRPYNEETHKGLLRHVVARYGFNTGDIMVVLITNGADIPRKDELIGLLRDEIPELKSICQNVNTARTNVIFGDKTKVLWGDDVIYDTIGDIRFAISPRSFYQVNPVQTEVLYGKALDYAGLTGEETVIDAYCGIGTISLFLAQRARQVYGVEIVSEAIDDARRNALLNDVRNVEFQVGAAEEVIPAWKRQGITPDVIVVDPPRKGCDTALLGTILEMRPERVVYVSCNPSTLARDLRVLEDGGYATVEVQPVDMFPHTVHVEVTVRLERKDTVN
ncbi:23S rRNA (uracil(1939)-C(5))-methyltransferase RlmD [Paenibacillus xerothermodurans]|uniref:23S rRNA (Uracil(1939)-C(5))-methyltransferase RlmD n=1 Tax=Paenibacillus xerothermodurans TaxID=1977292 RepID=A0A2W1N9G2_PAEXE|nr:23S rRNA (uracil(1939)-C(5))-methyltransferase RlmD [Paenibacillus xerothermodurans]PZE20300.1 23S rRNA (uracil(1939)-C(5))-methyltransferase RlmD [Paenibacillus xerothermodurans]